MEEEAMVEEVMAEEVMEEATAAEITGCEFQKNHLKIPSGTDIGEGLEDMDIYMQTESQRRCVWGFLYPL